MVDPQKWQRSSMFTFISMLTVTIVIATTIVSALTPILLPTNHPLIWESRYLATGFIFVGCYLAIAIGKIPGLRIDRTGIALLGAGLMVASGALPLEDAYKAVDLDTLTLLLGMMIVIASLRISGFFSLVNAWGRQHARRPLVLLSVVVAISGFLSAFLVNDAICLVLTPMVLELTLALKRKPVPYLLAVAMASNVGSTATITGNPQNIMIGSFSHIPYGNFALALGPVAIMGLISTVILIALFYRTEFSDNTRLEAPAVKTHINRTLVLRTLIATLTMIGLFFAGVAPAKAAIIIGGLLLLSGRVKSYRVLNEIDWTLLLMFSGLFIIVAGAQHVLVTPGVISTVGRLHLDQVPMLTALTAILSNLVSNVPAVLMLKPFVEILNNQDKAWLVIAMASTLAGNFTILGSIANLIVVQKSAASGVVIGFWDYFRIGAPLTIITLIIGMLWLSV